MGSEEERLFSVHTVPSPCHPQLRCASCEQALDSWGWKDRGKKASDGVESGASISLSQLLASPQAGGGHVVMSSGCHHSRKV